MGFLKGLEERVQVGQGIETPQGMIVPEARAWTFLGRSGGVVWNCPTAVWVEDEAETRRIPIVDITRRATWAFLGLAMLFVVVGINWEPKERRGKDERERERE